MTKNHPVTEQFVCKTLREQLEQLMGVVSSPPEIQAKETTNDDQCP